MTLVDAQDMLTVARQGYKDALQAQQWSASGRQVSRATLFRLFDQVRFWERAVARIKRGGMTTRYIIPIDS